VVGASGAFFGLMGAFFIMLRSLGQNPQQLLLLIVINLGIGFFVSGISWEGHLGGLITGAAIAAVYSETRRRNQRFAQLLGIAAIIGVLILLTLWGVERLY
jgi:membrane associated rhomboid family serine protease